MSFRRRITLVAAAAVAIAVVLGSMLTYLLTSHQLRSQVDAHLRHRVRFTSELLRALDSPAARAKAASAGLPRAAVAGAPVPPPRATPRMGSPASPTGTLPARAGTVSGVPARSDVDRDLFARAGPGQVWGYSQVIGPGGSILLRSQSGFSLPVDARARRLAGGGGERVFYDDHVGGVHLRILAEPFGRGRAVQLAQPLTEVDSLLGRLRLILVLLGVGGIALAALLGRLVAGAAMQPLKRLTQATEHVALTQDLSGRIRPVGEDEIGRLARSFNAMLDALERSISALDASVHAQRQLVADTSHELRTPVTSLRTNIEILQRTEEMDPEDRRRLLDDVVEQIEELTLLIGDLIDLARGEEPQADAEDMRLDVVVGDVVERARRRAPATPLRAELEPTILAGIPARLERAVSNLIDNAIKYSPPGEPVEIRLRGRELTVRDHGPGIPEEDRPYVFDRFYRGADARGRPGSGLGLAIVRQVVSQHGGSVRAEPAPGGGTLMLLRLPDAEPTRLDGAGTPAASARSPVSARSAV